ncbi:histone-lysine N-methyltransferase SETMAR isoform X2 [Mixophyes fleayi]|uniref:histone-lysine N-methyltransferase SETMAR isoform X2 n=1 Tax=Mixophyes fleayi TaxID=3061075 RepID=UPI003F4D8A8A
MDPEDVGAGREALPVPVSGPWTELPAFQYTPDLVAGPGAELDPSEVTIQGCDCQGPSCAPEECTCLPDGDHYVDRRICRSQKPVLECNILCTCRESCTNRETQRGLQFRLLLCQMPGKGWGVRTQEDIPSGRFVCEYAGEVLGQGEARCRIQSQDPNANNYIIAVREHLHSRQILQTFVDPTYKGNVGRFLNHSCQPNLFMLPVRTHSMVPKLALFAARDIQAAEELCYDYSGRSFNLVLGGEAQNGGREEEEGERSSRKRCLCGTAICTRYLPYDSSLYNADTQEPCESC